MDTSEKKMEWYAWQALVKELRDLGIDINKHDDLCEAIKTWGHYYHQLQEVKELVN